MFTTRKWWLPLVAALVVLSPVASRADGMYSQNFTVAVAGPSINNIGTAIAFHQLTWTVVGTASVCTVALDTSADGITWSAGGAITGQTCTSNGTSTVTNHIVNYVRINVTALTVTAGSRVNVVWNGYINTPSGGGTVTGTGASPEVAFWSSPTALTGSSTFTWADGTNATGLFTGVPTASLDANLQVYFFGYLIDSAANTLIPVGSSATGFVGAGSRLQVDKDISGYGHYVALDMTNLVSQIAVGHQEDTYYNVPMGATNNNVQVSYENNLFSYGAGTSLGSAAFEAGLTNTGTGTVTEGYSYLGSTIANTGGGTIHRAVEFNAQDLATVGDTLNAAFRSEAQTVGAHNWSFYDDNLANKDRFGDIYQNALMFSHTAPSVLAAGCGGSAASITINNGTAAFTVNVGTSNTGTCTITMPAATTDWNCSATDITNTTTLVTTTKAVPGGAPTTQITLQNYTDISGTHAWVDSDKIQVRCVAE